MLKTNHSSVDDYEDIALFLDREWNKGNADMFSKLGETIQKNNEVEEWIQN